MADRLIPLLDAQTLIVVSTDLSHYHPYEEARRSTARTVKAICDLDPDELTAEDACGYVPVLTLIDIARRKGWKAQPLDYRNSGDTAGDKSRVVGYAAIAFFDPNAGRNRRYAAIHPGRAAPSAGTGAQERRSRGQPAARRRKRTPTFPKDFEPAGRASSRSPRAASSAAASAASFPRSRSTRR